MFSWLDGVIFRLPFTQILLRWTNNFVGRRWTRGSRRTSGPWWRTVTLLWKGQKMDPWPGILFSPTIWRGKKYVYRTTLVGYTVKTNTTDIQTVDSVYSKTIHQEMEEDHDKTKTSRDEGVEKHSCHIELRGSHVNLAYYNDKQVLGVYRYDACHYSPSCEERRRMCWYTYIYVEVIYMDIYGYIYKHLYTYVYIYTHTHVLVTRKDRNTPHISLLSPRVTQYIVYYTIPEYSNNFNTQDHSHRKEKEKEKRGERN